jgi:hypothetical protein
MKRQGSFDLGNQGIATPGGDPLQRSVEVIGMVFLRKVLERRGINDDQVTSLLIVERYQRHADDVVRGI